jgi:scyllo-inositol 2-dehydrogenase (NAD+)
MRKLGVGVLGVGEMGKRHAENLRRMVPEARLVAVADPFPERARQTAGELEIDKYFTGLEDLLACKEVDTVVITTPDKFHAGAIMATARAGKNIFCEKPIALKMADAETAVAEVTKARVRIQVGFMRRYDPGYAAAMKRIEAGEIGEPVIFKSVGRDKDAPPMSAFQSGINGMLFYTNTIHDFDLARWLMRDEVTEVHAHTTCAIRPEIAQYGDVVAGVVNLKFERGAIGNVESYQQAVYGYDVRTEIVGSKGAIFVGTLQRTPAVFLSADGRLQNLADHFLTTFADAYVLEMRDFVHNILHDKPLRVSANDGIKALAIAATAEASHLQKKPIRISAQHAAA